MQELVDAMEALVVARAAIDDALAKIHICGSKFVEMEQKNETNRVQENNLSEAES